MNLDQYPSPLFILVGIGKVKAVPPSAGYVLGPYRPDPQHPYECGFEAFDDARMKFDVRYYPWPSCSSCSIWKSPSSSPLGRGIAGRGGLMAS